MSPAADVVPLYLLGAVIALALCVSYFDLRERRIPNRLLAAAMCFGFGVYAWAGEALGLAFVSRALLYSLMGMLLGAICLLPAYFVRQMGAGDVKLLMVFGFLLGPIGAGLTLLTGALLGGAWAMWLSWRSGGLRQAFFNLRMMARSAWLTGFKELHWDLRSAGAVTMPYGVALSAGAILVALWQLALRLP
ncbi:MAG: prepilin peptidase [Burkholderiales bacterium]|nr:prepilin peptidase [Burkholderiales bacterium]